MGGLLGIRLFWGVKLCVGFVRFRGFVGLITKRPVSRCGLVLLILQDPIYLRPSNS